MIRMISMMAVAIAMTGCATRGVIDIKCTNFVTYPLESSQLVRDIQQDVPKVSPIAHSEPALNEPQSEPDPMAAAFDRLATGPIKGKLRQAPLPVLLLSGGGQWGAFGAGFLDSVNRTDEKRLPEFGVITGVSTGALQSLFVSTGMYSELLSNYSPQHEDEIVNRNAAGLAVITGSIAGLKPLRKKIEAALCPAGPSEECPLITKLAHANPVFIGFVEAGSGKFVFADPVAIARAAKDGANARANAQQCLTGITLASSAMPVFFQQVSINRKTYFDGGVRHSVFEHAVATRLEAAVMRARDKAIAGKETSPQPPLYVVRNGPTTVRPDDQANNRRSALDAALRGEAIVVNELEVSSIAALRLAHPQGDIFLVTADGYDSQTRGHDEVCDKPPGVMFDPLFMACLRRFGVLKAGRNPAWISLSELPLKPIEHSLEEPRE